MSRVTSGAMAALLLALAAGSAGLIETGCRTAEPAVQAAQKASKYRCPMHPTYVSDRPGDCPVCGMRLVPMESSAPADTSSPHRHAEAPAGLDRVTVTLSPQRSQVLGIRTEPVVMADIDRSIRTVGRVAVDERRVHHIHTKFEGYIETLYVDFTGKFVRRGEPLVSVFSPEVVATQEEYLLSVRARKRLQDSPVASVSEGSALLLEAARRRLLLWDIPKSSIERLERTGELERSLDLLSPVSGFVVEKTAFHGMRVMPSDTLFDIADLSTLWILADVYEQDLALVRAGAPAELSVAYLSGRVWKGAVTWIAPTVEEKTRTVKVRVEVRNDGAQLKPGMFADVILRSPATPSLAIPESALIRSGERNLVFVDEGGGRFAPREVRLGRKGAAGIEVLAGVVEGERVVVSANFLIDSESSLKAAVSAMSRPAEAAGRPAPAHRH